MTTIYALIPARCGSERVPGKNIRPLGGHPLIAWTIRVAQASGLYQRIIVSTDSPHYAQIAHEYGAETVIRSAEAATSISPDIDWLEEYLQVRPLIWPDEGEPDAIAILRPTNPFRTTEMLWRAYLQFIGEPGMHSLRAVEPVQQHPAKMWILWCDTLWPLWPIFVNGIPGHEHQKSMLPPVYVQNASLEMVWTHVIDQYHVRAGARVLPFLTEGLEGFDINYECDWEDAERFVREGKVSIYEPTEAVQPACLL